MLSLATITLHYCLLSGDMSPKDECQDSEDSWSEDFMNRRTFLREYRLAIDRRTIGPHNMEGLKLNDTERWLWVQNDYELYQLAKSLGVKVD